MKFLRFAQIASVWCVLALGGMSAAHAADAKDLLLKGDAKCTGCHDEADDATPTMLELRPSVLSIGKTRHGVQADARTPTCTNCHGESKTHVEHKGKDKPPKPDSVFGKNSKTTTETKNAACLTCHAKDSKRTHWEGSAHAGRDVACSSCHRIHTDHDKVMSKQTQSEVCYACHKTQRSESHKLSTHPLAAGKMSCSDCHNPHGSTGPKMLVKNSINDTCYTCHAEKRGPFLWEHSPSTDDCTNCHLTHGANTPAMLKARPPFLCQQCHQDHGAGLKDGSGIPNGVGSPAVNQVIPGTAEGKFLSVQANGRKCVACHVMVHGSNHPAGAALTR